MFEIAHQHVSILLLVLLGDALASLGGTLMKRVLMRGPTEKEKDTTIMSAVVETCINGINGHSTHHEEPVGHCLHQFELCVCF